MSNNCFANTLENIKSRNSSSFKQPGMLDAIIVFGFVGQHFFHILRCRLNNVSWKVLSEVLSACSERLITPTMLKMIFNVCVFDIIMLFVAGLFAFVISFAGLVYFEVLFAEIPISLGVIHTFEVLSEVVEELMKHELTH